MACSGSSHARRINTNLYDGNIWRFVGAFLVLRAITLLLCGLVVGGLMQQSLGEVTANWLSTTWISTGEGAKLLCWVPAGLFRVARGFSIDPPPNPPSLPQ